MLFGSESSKFNFISSIFTRSKGYNDIRSSKPIPHNKAVSILNSFTPQGASPKKSVRISTYGDMIGAGYYWMENMSNARLSIILTKFDDFRCSSFLPPMDAEDIPSIAKGNKTFSLRSEYEIDGMFNIADKFGIERGASILYSLLCGDNLIIVHPEAETRFNFFRTLLSLVPCITFKYNRITTGCEELIGNENIVGVNELPKKYRSHKKLYLPLDTIFVDLNSNTIEGEGIKNSDYTRMLVELSQYDLLVAQNEINELFNNIIGQKYTFSRIFDDTEISLIHRIETKLGLRSALSQEWIMF